MDLDQLLEEQKAYYRARAPEYDRWWSRTHQYELPPGQQAVWVAEKAQLVAWIDQWVAATAGPILELACGTGIWTQRLAATDRLVTAVDASPETLRIAAAKDGMAPVDFIVADLFAWEPPPAAFGLVFFGFWLSHVPPERFDAFWAKVGRALRPGGQAVFVDNLWRPGDWPAVRPTEWVQTRTDISSGETFRIVKRYDEPDELAARLVGLGWSAHVTATDHFFVAGYAST